MLTRLRWLMLLVAALALPVLAPPANAGVRWGVSTGPPWDNPNQHQLAVMRELMPGLGVHLYWEYDPGMTRLSGWAIRGALAYQRAGFRIEPVLRYKGTSPAGYARFVHNALIELTRIPAVVDVQLGNEADRPCGPDCDGGRPHVFRALRLGFFAAQRAHTEIPVGLNISMFDHRDRVLLWHLRGAPVDWLGIDDYPNATWPLGPVAPGQGIGAQATRSVLSLLRLTRGMMRASGLRNTPIHFSEFGYVASLFTPAERAAGITASVRTVRRYAARLNVTAFYYFALRDWPSDPAGYGLLSAGWKPQPAFYAYRAALRG